MQSCPEAVNVVPPHLPVSLPDHSVSEIAGETKPPPSSPLKAEEAARAGERGSHPSRRQVKPNAKLSAFFSVVKRAAVVAPETAGEYFQPFFAKPDQRLAPTNAFEECAIVKTPLLAAGTAYSPGMSNGKTTRWGRGLCVPGSRQRSRCKCLGADSKPAYLVAKLLQFHTSYRPAYFGTWRQLRPEISGRHPLRKAVEIDYDHDSDDDWGEDAEILDAESIAGSEEDDEEDEEEEGEEEDEEAGGEGGRRHHDGLEGGDEFEEPHVPTATTLHAQLIVTAF